MKDATPLSAGRRLAGSSVATVGVLVIAVWVTYAFLVHDITTPTVLADEAGLLGNARWMAGGKHWPMHGAAFYETGYPVLLVPIFATIRNPFHIYRAALLLNVAMIGCLAIIVVKLAQSMFQISIRRATLAAACAVAYPAIWVQVGVAWAEITLMLIWALWFLTLWRVLVEPRTSVIIAHALISGYAYMVHGRFVVLPILAAAGCIAMIVRLPAVRKGAACGLATVGVVVIMANRLSTAVFHERWAGGNRRAVTSDDVLSAFPAGLLRVAAGQAWYLLVGTVGLGLVGFVQAVLLTRHGPRCESGEVVRDGTTHLFSRAAATYVITAVTGAFLVSVSFMAGAIESAPATQRVDYTFYGRYNEAMVPTFIGIAVAAIQSEHFTKLCSRTLYGAGAIATLCIFIALGLQGQAAYTGVVSEFTVTAIEPLLLTGSDLLVHSRLTILWISLAGVVAMAVLGLSIRWAASLSMCAVGGIFVILGLLSLNSAGNTIRSTQAVVPTYRELRASHPVTVAYDMDNLRVYGFFAGPFFLNESDIVEFRTSDTIWPEADLFIGPFDWPEAEARGMRLVRVDPILSQSFWAPSGDEMP